ncbi:hypothetical protein [Alteromonas macleodii]|uniref:hypothetical protein n=1 Tax=Alteromonas macleodii TaxID=28108 RepID=UPI00066E8E40|nr:hypothetical protein [Alteromonas macleodii]CAI3954213.1 hypothetical protein MIT1002_01894 [Alteromonas macleodii]VTP52398.1 hypothetical protein MIT1002_01894 [Alteromonas macleodii]|tara:strand:- start:944 stop:1483 length:540 start_codon:yes stop_codon:yes gene_type:complete
MSQIKCFTKAGDILAKVVREGRRINFASNDLELSDSIFNFSVTAHSMRDWCIKELGWDTNSQQKQSFHDTCNAYEYLKYARDIANGSKHFGLDNNKTSTVDRVENNSGSFSYIDAHGNTLGQSAEAPTAKILLPDGKDILAFTFAFTVIQNWKEIMVSHQLTFDEARCKEINIALAYAR